MNDLFVPFKIAKRLKDIGFDEPCFMVFRHGELKEPALNEWFNHNSRIGNTISAPLYSQVIDWFRVKYGYHIFIERDSEMWMVRLQNLNDENYDGVLEVDLSGETHYSEIEWAKIAMMEYICQVIEPPV